MRSPVVTKSYCVRGNSLISISSQTVQEGSAGLQLHVHVRHLSLHQLEFSDLLSELFSLLAVVDSNIEGCLHQSDWASTENKSLVVEPTHQHVNSLIDFTKDVFGWDLQVLEDQLGGWGSSHTQLVKLLGNLESL